MRRPAPIEKETQGTAKPSLASRCFRQARRPCRQYVDLPRRRRHLLPQSFFSVRYFPGVVNPGGTEPVKKVAAERKIRSMGESKTGLGTMERSMPIRLRPAREEDPAALRELFLSRRFRQPARKPNRRADIGAGSGMRDPAREQTAAFPCAPLPHPAKQGAAAENGRGTERRKTVPSQGRRQEYKPQGRFLLAFGAPSELERVKIPGRQREGFEIAGTGARITAASPRKRMGRNAKRSAPGRGPGKFPLPPGRKLAGSPSPSNRG